MLFRFQNEVTDFISRDIIPKYGNGIPERKNGYRKKFNFLSEPPTQHVCFENGLRNTQFGCFPFSPHKEEEFLPAGSSILLYPRGKADLRIWAQVQFRNSSAYSDILRKHVGSSNILNPKGGKKHVVITWSKQSSHRVSLPLVRNIYLLILVVIISHLFVVLSPAEAYTRGLTRLVITTIL